jgi:hypothetical protein
VRDVVSVEGALLPTKYSSQYLLVITYNCAVVKWSIAYRVSASDHEGLVSEKDASADT